MACLEDLVLVCKLCYIHLEGTEIVLEVLYNLS